MRPKPKPIDRLMEAMDRCAIARGEAQWTHGYRTAVFASRPSVGESEADRLWERERRQFAYCGRAERAFRRLAMRLLREASRG